MNDVDGLRMQYGHGLIWISRQMIMDLLNGDADELVVADITIYPSRRNKK